MADELDVVAVKTCSKCNLEQQLSEFYAHPTTTDRKQSQCKTCSRNRYRENPDYREAALENARRQRSVQAPGEAARISREWRAARLEKARTTKRQYVQKQRNADPEKARATWRVEQSRRRSLKRDQFIEDVDPFVVYKTDNGICGICNELTDINDFHVDHIIPLSRGGLHGYRNVQVAHPECNLSKSNKLPDEL